MMDKIYLTAGIFFIWASTTIVMSVFCIAILELWWRIYKSVKGIPYLIRKTNEIRKSTLTKIEEFEKGSE